MVTTMIRVPASTDEFIPPRTADLTTEAANFIRAHWDDVKQYLQMISGEVQSKHDSYHLDEAEFVFEVKRIAVANGFALLGTVSTNKLRKALRRGYKRNTGTSVRMLEKQNRRLRIEAQSEQ